MPVLRKRDEAIGKASALETRGSPQGASEHGHPGRGALLRLQAERQLDAPPNAGTVRLRKQENS